MYLSGAFANINKILVNVRISDIVNRCGGIKYFRSCKKLLKYMKKIKLLTFLTILKVVLFDL